MTDRRDPAGVTHTLTDVIRAHLRHYYGLRGRRHLDYLRRDPAFKLACGRLPDSGDNLCSQPTLSRLENAPGLRDLIRLTNAVVNAWMDSYFRPPRSLTLDIDDTCDVVAAAVVVQYPTRRALLPS